MGSPCITDVTFDKNQYYAGDICNVYLSCDNSQCTSGVKSFKIKLKRKVFAMAKLTKDSDLETIKTSKYLYQFKDTEHKCGPNMKVERTLTFKIPKIDPDLPSQIFEKHDEVQRAVINGLTGSHEGPALRVIYSLKVFVKHDTITQMGEGECVTLPIRIVEIDHSTIVDKSAEEGSTPSDVTTQVFKSDVDTSYASKYATNYISWC